MTNENEAPEHGYLICKNGLFYRPDSCGYTSAKSEAGRYSLNMAIDTTHPNGPDGPRDGMTYIHETEVPDTRAALSDAKDKRIEELEAERDEQVQWVKDLADDVISLEAKLAKAMDGLRECEGEIDQYIRQEYPHDHPVQERYRQRDFAANPARTTLAELKGTDQ